MSKATCEIICFGCPSAAAADIEACATRGDLPGAPLCARGLGTESDNRHSADA